MANEVQEYQQVQDTGYEVVEIPKGDWTGESLKHGLVNSYFYFDIFKQKARLLISFSERR
mgnify:CR=1 FL=1